MQRYFIETAIENARISGEDARHIERVMRMKQGDKIVVVAQNTAHICTIEGFEGDEVVIEATGQTIPSPELPIYVTVACGLPKGDKLELITQKATELGMFALQPFEAERSIVKWDKKKGAKKQERLQKIAKEAAEQAHRTHIPEVFEPITFKQLLQQIDQFDAVFIADEEDAKAEKRTRFAEKLKNVYDKKSKSMLIIFGPEGGISRQESEALLHAGAQTMSLGPRILRAETAPLYALSAISYEFE
ncbi:16S rRNA (uracil(1498)-N(3))-methyltransferase [Lysinibacillus fusiformis]|uniref:16S rRNA (uracil(1498)-N(3))-methyltransferase n=1 Tax=Lysinibacillus TaxID=400634 RepID=UPI0023303752|nr:16S rRNA (uracil(1498)-N(3))-methyltransferase [Lysinibacillus sp. OF-1]MEE3805877.1 16S rRNA (uracil(1498)-N(3))-methyltransferase [Lysinibacillus fusiformis]WCH46420.1 16S rRNA (uracil(1498)-N(3))-methyltransferase [Lysinibacillus sp. OF-1]